MFEPSMTVGLLPALVRMVNSEQGELNTNAGS